MPTLQKLPLLSLLLLPIWAQAQSKPVAIEKSKIVGADNMVHLFGLPARDSEGNTRYWDTTITLEINSSGRPSTATLTRVVRQDRAKSTEFVPGNYKHASFDLTCTLSNSAFEGRTMFDMRCGAATFSWFTGPIAGHPWEADLVASQLHLLVGHDEYAWGRMLVGGFSDCFGSNRPLLSARQVGNDLTLVNYGPPGTGNAALCQWTFVRQP